MGPFAGTFVARSWARFDWPRILEEEEEEEEEEFFNHYKNDLERHAHTPSGVAGADLKRGFRFSHRRLGVGCI